MRNDKITPLYERLSRDDGLQGDSNSIVHQELCCKGKITPPKYNMTAAHLWRMKEQLWERSNIKAKLVVTAVLP